MKKTNIYLIVIIILGAFLRFFSLTTRPFNGDEGLIALTVSNGFLNIFTKSALDVHPPLLHILTYLSTQCFGINEWSVRLPSVLAGIGIIYFGWLLARKFINEKIALILAFLLAICPYLIYFSQEARMYSLFGFFSLVSFYYFLTVTEKPKFINFFLYIVSSILMIYAQYLGFFVLFIQFIYLLANYKKIKQYWLGWLASFIVILLTFLPQSFIFYRQFIARSSEQSQAIILSNNIKGLFGAFYRFGVNRLFLDINPSSIKNIFHNNIFQFIGFIISLILPLILFFRGLCGLCKKYNSFFWFIILVFISVSLLTILSAEVGYRANRYLIFAAPFYFLTVSYGFYMFWRNKNYFLKILPCLFVILWLFSLSSIYFKENRAPGANIIAQYVKNNYQVNDAVLIRGGFGGGEKWVFNYYYNKQRPTQNQQIAIVDIFEQYKIGNLSKLKSIDPQDEAAEMLKNYNRVWFYDFTYSNFDINGKKHILGKDKEEKDLILWEIVK